LLVKKDGIEERIGSLGTEFEEKINSLLKKHREIREYNEKQKQLIKEESIVTDVIDKFWEQLKTKIESV
jgi:hypothetical protein